MQPSRPVIFQDFLNHIKYERRLSVHTVRAYSDDIISFFDYVQQQFDIADPALITTPIVRSWIADLSVHQVEPRSINRKLSSLKALFKYAQLVGYLKGSPVKGIPVLKVKKRLPVYIEQEKMERLLGEVDFTPDFKGLTSYLIVSLLYHTGIRVSELAGLKLNQLDLSRSQIKVLGKGNKERIIPVHASIVALIKNYLSAKDENFPDTTCETVLISGKHKPLSSRQVYEIVRQTLLKVTTAEKRGPHILRHSFATHLTSNGAELNAVKALLGHASLASTQVYTHNSIERLRDVHRRAHPKG